MKEEYIRVLHGAVEAAFECGAVYSKTEPVTETFEGKTVWDGEVLVFDLQGHPEAKRCYAWMFEPSMTKLVLEIPPVKDAKTAVQVAIVAESKKK